MRLVLRKEESENIFKRIVHTCLAVALFATPALALGVWGSIRNDKMQVVLGEGTNDEAYTADKVKAVKGYDADFKEVELSTEALEDHVNI